MKKQKKRYENVASKLLFALLILFVLAPLTVFSCTIVCLPPLSQLEDISVQLGALNEKIATAHKARERSEQEVRTMLLTM